MKKILAIALCVLVQVTFGNTNSLVELAKSLDDLTNGWYKLTYDPNSTATWVMCPKCAKLLRLPLWKVVKVGRSQLKCNNIEKGKRCNHTMWYVDEWMLLNFSHTKLRTAAIIANKAIYKAISRGDNSEAEEWLGRLETVRDELAKLAIKKKRYLDRKKRR